MNVFYKKQGLRLVGKQLYVWKSTYNRFYKKYIFFRFNLPVYNFDCWEVNLYFLAVLQRVIALYPLSATRKGKKQYSL